MSELGFIDYCIHRCDIPGKPDLAWIGLRLAIFVHGYFWYRHNCKEGQRRTKSNQSYWVAKIDRNSQRDQEHVAKLEPKGWQVLVISKCEFSDIENLRSKLMNFLEFSDKKQLEFNQF